MAVKAGIQIVLGKPFLVHALGGEFQVEAGTEGARNSRQHRDLAVFIAVEGNERLE